MESLEEDPNLECTQPEETEFKDSTHGRSRVLLTSGSLRMETPKQGALPKLNRDSGCEDTCNWLALVGVRMCSCVCATV